MRTRSVGLTVPACAVALAATAEAQEQYVKIHTDVRSGGAMVYHLDVNPFVVGVGVGYRF